MAFFRCEKGAPATIIGKAMVEQLRALRFILARW